MKSKLLLLVMGALLWSFGAQANYDPASYEVEGTRLVKWKGNESMIDFTFDPVLNTITEIAGGAFQYKGDVKRIILPASLRKIGTQAFYECGMLSVVNFAEGLQELAPQAFCRCPALTTLDLPASLETIGEAPTMNCQGLTSFTLPASNTHYKSVEGVLYNATGQTLIDYPAGREGSFTLPEGVSRIGDYAFAFCSGLDVIKLGNQLKELGRGAFRESSSLRGIIEIPGAVQVISDSAFYLCENVREIRMAEGVCKIGIEAFGHCSSVEKITMPSTVTELGESCFSFLSRLSSFYNHMKEPLQGRQVFWQTKTYQATLYVPAESVELYKAQTSTWDAFNAYLPLEDIGQIPPSSYKLDETGRTLIQWIGPETVIDFSKDSVLNRVRTIGTAAFLNKSVQKVILPEALETIGERAFLNCEELTDVVTNDRLRSIGNRAFWNNFALQSFMLPQSIELVASDAFGYCTHLTGFFMTAPNEYYKVVDKVLLTADGKHLVCYPSLRGEEYTLPKGVTTIDPDAAAGAEGLVQLTLPEGLKEIGESAFQGSSRLQRVDLPASLENFGNGAFMRCRSLTEYTVADGNKNYKVSEKSLYSTDMTVFYAFPEASGTMLRIPDGIECIAPRACQRNESLKELVLPASLEELGDFAFYFCSQLQRVTILRPHPISQDRMGDSPFLEIAPKAVLIVPKGSAEIYSKTPVWSDFIIQEGDTPIQSDEYVIMITNKPVGSKINFLAINSNYTDSDMEGVHMEGNDMIIDNSTITLRGEIFSLSVPECGLTMLDVTHAPHLKFLMAPHNELTTVDLTNAPLMESIILPHNQLTSLPHTAMPELTALFVYDNQLTELDMSDETALKELHVFSNRIAGESMTRLLESLPQRLADDNAKLFAIDSENVDEGNVFNDTHLQIAQQKNWTAYDYCGGINDGNGVAISSSVTPISADAAFNVAVSDPYLTISGARAGSVVQIYTLSGNLLYDGVCTAQGDCHIDISAYSVGNYIVTVNGQAQRIQLVR